MPEIPDALRAIKQEVDEGTIPIATVRTLLSWFNQYRRSWRVVERIRTALDALNLLTIPDFEGEFIDNPIGFHRKVASPASANQAPSETSGPTAVAAGVADVGVVATVTAADAVARVEPAYRIGKLDAANRPPISVKPDAPIAEAVTLMLVNDYSQLPVMTNEREVKGILSWKSLGSRLALNRNCIAVRDCMDSHKEVSADDSLFTAIPIIAEFDCVLVRAADKKITGIVTASDVSEQFGQLAEPFLLLAHIENEIRAIISSRFSADDVRSIAARPHEQKQISSVAEMAFGDYVGLLQQEQMWQKLGTTMDRRTFVSDLDEVRLIRNGVMHFRPDGIGDDELVSLRRFSAFLDRLKQLSAL